MLIVLSGTQSGTFSLYAIEWCGATILTSAICMPMNIYIYIFHGMCIIEFVLLLIAYLDFFMTLATLCLTDAVFIKSNVVALALNLC